MQEDFHFSVGYMLSRCAGLPPGESRIGKRVRLVFCIIGKDRGRISTLKKYIIMEGTMTDINVKKAIARNLVGARYSIDNPDLNIRATLDEPVEQIATGDYYNGPAAKWVALSTPFVWVPLNYEDLDKVRTVRDLGKIIFAHLGDKPTAAGRDVFRG